VYFYMGKHDLALVQLNDVINSGMYDLKDAPIEAFNRISGEGVSNEVIWEIALNSTSTKFDRNPTIFSKCNYTANGGGRGTNRNMCAWTAFTMSYSILQQIGWINADLSEPVEATKDLRYQQTYIRLEGYQPNPYKSGTAEYYAFINKYESRYPALTYPMVYQDKHFRAPTSGRRSNRPMLRLADMLLMRSIIRFNNGDKTGAAEDLNVVRERAGLNDIAANDITERAIENERIKEMSGEHADRLFWLIGLRKDIGIGDRDASKFQVIKAPYSNYYWQVPELEKQNNSAYQ
ncbi:MAG: RagB/SusD family nutrient uptake outer membrane protein, partial [Bacteroidaceae bacterium]|nr:RagB/SusD family nutrient uptake outer membrane protein [Bacteroidaceae bacterium]